MPQNRSAPYRFGGMGQTGICGMGHTTSEVNSGDLNGFVNECC